MYVYIFIDPSIMYWGQQKICNPIWIFISPRFHISLLPPSWSCGRFQRRGTLFCSNYGGGKICLQVIDKWVLGEYVKFPPSYHTCSASFLFAVCLFYQKMGSGATNFPLQTLGRLPRQNPSYVIWFFSQTRDLWWQAGSQAVWQAGWMRNKEGLWSRWYFPHVCSILERVIIQSWSHLKVVTSSSSFSSFE